MRSGTSTALWGTGSTAVAHTASRPSGPSGPRAAPQWAMAGERPSVTSSTTETPDAVRWIRCVEPGLGAVTAVLTGVLRGDIDDLRDGT